MGKIRVGNKKNSGLNNQWAGHVRGWMKKLTSSLRRLDGKKEVKDRLENE